MRSFLFFISTVIIFGSCKKEATSWDIQTAVPLAEGSIQLYNAFADSLIEVDQNGQVDFVLNTNLLGLAVDTLFQLPDTTTEQFFLLPVGPIDFPPGHVLFNDTQNTVFSINQADLSRIVTQQGQLNVEIKSTIGELTLFTYSLPFATKNGVPFSYTGTIPAGSFSNPASQIQTLDLTGYDINLRGINQDKYNTLVATYLIQIDPNGSITTIFPGDYYQIEITSKSIVPSYARGILDSRTETIIESENLDVFNQIIDGKLNLDKATIDLKIINEVGVDMTATINELSNSNSSSETTISLDAPIVGERINLTRARETNGPNSGYEGFVYTSTLTSNNSNVAAFISNLPDQIQYDVEFGINPLNSSSLANDFLYYGSGVRLELDANIPLSFSAENITLRDTSEFTLSGDSTEVEELDPVQGGDLFFFLSNSYPFDVYAQFYFLDSNFIVLDSAFESASLMSGAIPENNGRVVKPVESILSMPLTTKKIETIEEAYFLLFEGRFSTVNQPDTLQFYNDYLIEYQVIGEIEYRVDIE